MGTPDGSDELATLERLRSDEAVLDGELRAARDDAEQAVATARADAARERERAATVLARDLAALRDATRREEERIAAEALEQARRRIARMDEGAEARRAAALALVVAAVEGRSA